MRFFDRIFKTKENPREEKNKIEDFFRIKINDIFSENPTFKESTINTSGYNVKRFALRFKELELGTFHEAIINDVSETNYNIIFSSFNTTVTRELADFINFMAEKYGLDDSGNGKISQKDINGINKGKFFSRLWLNFRPAIMIDNNEKYISMSILGIKKPDKK